MRYVPWGELAGEPNIIVDGFPTGGTVLTLSHWPGSGTPASLADDLSTQITFRYLDRPDVAVAADAVSNNHFDEDGLCSAYALVHPHDALARRALLIDVASAGDFGTFRHREGARVAMALGVIADEDRSPLDPAIFDLSYAEQSAALYRETLVMLPQMLDDLDRFRDLWAEGDATLARDEARIARGEIAIEELPAIDLAIVRVPPGGADDAGEWSGGVHPYAIHNATRRHRILITNGTRHVVRYRYETWVSYVSEPTMPRVDLAPLARTLSDHEQNGRWSFDGNDAITPSLHSGGESSISSDAFCRAVVDFLTAAG